LFIETSYAQYYSCDCSTYDCGCCVDIPIVGSACANITWNAERLSVTVDLSVAGDVLIEQTYQDTSALALCTPIQDVCEYVCVDIQNLNITDLGACGTIALNASCFSVPVTFPLGNFYIGYSCDVPEPAFQGLFGLAVENAMKKMPKRLRSKFIKSGKFGKHFSNKFTKKIANGKSNHKIKALF